MNNKIFIVIGLAIIIALFASAFASSHPDGLEWVAEKLGFINQAQGLESLMTDYAFPGINNTFLATSLAGMIGVFVLLGLFWGASKIAKT